MSLSTKVLLALGVGIAAGLALSVTHSPATHAVVAVVEPVGTLFIAAIRMTVIPLVVSSLIVGIAAAESGADLARLGSRGIVLFVLLLLASGVVAALVAPPVLAHVSLDPSAIASLRSAHGTPQLANGSAALQTPGQWLASLVPANAMRAAVDGAMLPLIVFALLFGLGLLAVPAERRGTIVAILRGVAAAMLVIVEWLLIVAPLGVFALVLPLVARLGLSAVGALATYVVLVSVAAFAFMLAVIYPAAIWGGRVSLKRFARAALPAQAVAFSSRSSIAALPALIESARTRLGLSDDVATFFLPLASALFRAGASLGLVTGCLFIARLYGIAIGPTQLATLVVTSVLTSFSIPGIPGGSIFAMVPVLTSVGLPIEGIGILLGVDTIPDIFRTTTNVTGQLATAAIVGRDRRREIDIDADVDANS
ncbi:MAG TPA: dicarboxylate/amino acid:cation symporter [Gemmatimonadaceae bacterium]|nr:dicarboxylate/amino acid:cation symporter [Gemmatimonadaceae bacterium]